VSRPRLRPSPTVKPPLRPEEQQAARRRARDRSLLRDGIVLLLVVVGLSVAWALRLTPTPELPAAREVTARIDVAYEAVRAGTLELGTEPERIAEGIVGARVTTGDTARWVVTGQAGRECYAMWWDEDGTRRVRAVPSTLPCEPASQLTSPRPDTFDRIGRATPADEPTSGWDLVLPEPFSYRVWFLPAIIIGGGIGLSALVRITIALLTGNAPSAVRR
jgi:hypothetical protein